MGLSVALKLKVNKLKLSGKVSSKFIKLMTMFMLGGDSYNKAFKKAKMFTK